MDLVFVITYAIISGSGISEGKWGCRKPSPSPQKDMYRMGEVEEHTMPTTVDTKSTTNANGKQDKGKVRSRRLPE